jgi:hypothetical protein
MNLPCLPILLLLWLILPEPAATAAATDAAPQAPARPPLYSVTAGHGVPVGLTFEDASQLVEIRLYFKTMAADHYLFLPMIENGQGTYQAELPPARNWTKGIDCVLLRRSLAGEIRKSKPFRLLVLNDFSSPPPAAGAVPVEAEDAAATAKNQDFAVPLRVTLTAEPLLGKATEDPYPPIHAPGGEGGSSRAFEGLSGVSFFIRIGGASFRYGSFFRH